MMLFTIVGWIVLGIVVCIVGFAGYKIWKIDYSSKN